MSRVRDAQQGAAGLGAAGHGTAKLGTAGFSAAGFGAARPGQGGRNFRLIRWAITVLVACLLLPIMSVLMSTPVFAGPIEINAANFPDAVFRAYVSENFDIDADGMLSEEEVKAATIIDISSEECSSLEGIEHFPYLTRVSLYEVLVDSLDLDSMPALEYLNLVNTHVTSLDISNNPSLMELWLERNIYLTTVDISNNPALEELELYENHLTSLIVSNNPALEGLYCSRNQSAFFAVSDCPALEYFEAFQNTFGAFILRDCSVLSDAEFYRNEFDSFEIEDCPTLQTLTFYSGGLSSLDIKDLGNLRYLSVTDSQLTALTVSNCPALVELECEYNQLTALTVSDCPALEGLNCSDNYLASFDVSDCPVLRELNCSNNYLTFLDVSGFPALEYLTCDGNYLTSLDVSDNPALYSLSCSANQLTSLDVSDNSELQSLYCDTNHLTSLDVSDNPALYALSCGFNRLASLDVSGNPELRYLFCEGNQLTSLILNESNNQLYSLYCGSNQLLDIQGMSFSSTSTYIIATAQEVIIPVSENPTSPGVYQSEAEYFFNTHDFVLNGTSANHDETTGRFSTTAPDTSISFTTTIFTNGSSPYEISGSIRFVTSTSSGGIEINAVNFPSAMFRSYVATRIDEDRNGWLSLVEADRVTEISLDYGGWSDTLKGIEHFPHLRELFCEGQGLTSLDLSANPLLELLSCSENRLTSLDLSDRPALIRLSCSNNQITSLDLSNDFQLEHLDLYNNPLVSLDASNCTALTYLEFYGAQLASLDVSGCTALEGLYCPNNQLASLDVSGCIALQNLSCSNNQLISLDLSDSPSLYNLSCNNNRLTDLDLSNGSSLYNLSCYNNQLAVLDVSDCTALQYLSCSNNQLASLDLSSNLTLFNVDCDNNRLTSLDVNGNPALSSLSCANNQLASLDLSNNRSLYSLYCDNNQLTTLGLSNNSALQYLSCSDNQLTVLNVSNIPLLYSFSCDNNQLTALGLSNNSALQYLSCSNNRLTVLDVSNNPSLYSLYCSNNQLTALGLSNNSALQYLSCDDNQLTALDLSNISWLYNLSCSNNQLTTLDVSGNRWLYYVDSRHNHLLDIVGVSEPYVSIYGSGQTLTIPVSPDPNNPGSYLSDSAYPLGTHTISLPSTSLTSYDKTREQFTTSEINKPVRFETRRGENEELLLAGGTLIFTTAVVPPATYTVTFVDWDDTVISTDTVFEGTAAVAPASPERPGYTFTGWDRAFENVTSDLTVKAVYEPLPTYTVIFAPGDHGTSDPSIASDLHVGDPTPQALQPDAQPGWRFIGWEPELAPTVTGNATYTAQWERITYVVTFVDYDDRVLSSQTVIEGADAIPPRAPEQGGYVFDGWDRSFANITSNLTVKATYVLLCSITIDYGEHGFPPYSRSVMDFIRAGSPTPQLGEPPAEPGWRFVGWYPEPAPTVTESVGYVAQWEPIPYTVIFAPGDHGTSDPSIISDLHVGDPTPQALQPDAQPGWRFTGWEPELAPTVTGDATYTAQWERITYVVTFVDYDDRVLSTETVVEGTSAVAPVPPHRGGHIFIGWDTDLTSVTSDLTVRATYIATHAVAFYPGDHGTFPVTFIEFIPEGDPTPVPPWQPTGEPGWRFVGWYPELAPTVTEDTGYTAQWEPVTAPPASYRVTFVDFDDVVLSTETVFEGDDAMAPPDPVRPGYTFAGWDKPFTNVTSNLTVKALYTFIPLYSVTFDYGTHALFPILEVVDFIPEGSPTPAAPQPAAQSGWRFIGWQPALALTVTGDVTYTAQWERITHTVTFVGHDGTVLSTETVFEGASATAPLPPARPGYAFTGWDADFTDVTSDLTVRAAYAPLPTYTVTFTPGTHGTFAIHVNPGLHVGDLTPAAPQPVGESGWRFVGWQPALAPTVAGDVTYTAQWEEVVHTVTFVGPDGTVLSTRTVSDGAAAAPPVPPARPGYTFTGWDRTFDSVTSDLTVTALYTPLPTHTVTFAPGTHGAFAAESTSGLYAGDATPAAPRPTAESDWLFVGWLPALALTVTGDVTYTAQWEPAPAPPVTPAAHTVTFDPGTHGAFAAQITTGLSAGAVTPVAPQPAPQPGFRFIGWLPAFSPYVTGDVAYVAQWESEDIPPDIATPTPAPTPPAPPAPVAPPTVIVNTPPAETVPDQYITVPASDSDTGQTPSSSAGTGSSGNTGTGTGGSSSGTGATGAQQGQTLSDDQAPLADGTDGSDGATGTNILLFVLALVFLACLFGAGCLYMIRTKR